MSSPIARTFVWSHAYSIASPPCVPSTPTIFATSSAAPPPKPTTQSARWSRNARPPEFACDAVGLPATPSNTATSRPPSRNDATKRCATGSCASARSVTTSGRFRPCSFRCAPTSADAPAPKWIVVGKAKRWIMGCEALPAQCRRVRRWYPKRSAKSRCARSRQCVQRQRHHDDRREAELDGEQCRGHRTDDRCAAVDRPRPGHEVAGHIGGRGESARKRQAHRECERRDQQQRKRNLERIGQRHERR